MIKRYLFPKHICLNSAKIIWGPTKLDVTSDVWINAPQSHIPTNPMQYFWWDKMWKKIPMASRLLFKDANLRNNHLRECFTESMRLDSEKKMLISSAKHAKDQLWGEWESNANECPLSNLLTNRTVTKFENHTRLPRPFQLWLLYYSYWVY